MELVDESECMNERMDYEGMFEGNKERNKEK
jgi:hypothetical protein